MSLGYNRPLYLLPFDHRHSYLTGMFHASPPLTIGQRQAVIDSKRVIYDGFRQALMCGVPSDFAGILVDEEFGADILRNASSNGYVTAYRQKKAVRTSSSSNTARHSRSTSRSFGQPSPRLWCVSIPRAMLLSISGRPGDSSAFRITVEEPVKGSCSSSSCRRRARSWIASAVQTGTIGTSGPH